MLFIPFHFLALDETRPPNNLKGYRHCSRPKRRPPRSWIKLANVGPQSTVDYFCHKPFYIDRIQKLKDARADASKEIERYKQVKEQEFRAFESAVRFMPSLDQAPAL